MRRAAILLIDTYRKFVSPVFVSVFGRGCRYSPTCSIYARQAINKYGIVRGGTLSFKRIIRCHPLSRGYCDPVPKTLD